MFKTNISKGTICHYTAHFKTIDGTEHICSKFNYIATDKINCSAPEYIMSYIREDGYMTDDNDIMYILQNIVSISWKCDDSIDNVKLEDYQIFYNKPFEECMI